MTENQGFEDQTAVQLQMRMYSYFLGISAGALFRDALNFMLEHTKFLIASAEEAQDQKLVDIYESLFKGIVELMRILNEQRFELSSYYDEAVP